MKKYHFVYITRRIGTPYYYYGVHSTNNINDGYIGSGYHFLNAVRKYGKESFSREIIKFFESHDEALKFENEIITKEVLEDEYCYNIQHGGKGSKDEHSLSTKEKMSLSAKERKIPQETRNKLKESMKRKIELYGYYHSEETRKRISETLKSKDMGKYNKGRIQTESERNKRSISLKLAYKEGRHKKSDLSGDKNPMYGKHFTDSMKQNLSNAQKERFSNVLEREKTSISTASACPAGTLELYAASTKRLPKSSISFFNNPHAFVISSDFKELLQTSSAKSSELCAALLNFCFISYKFTFILLLASIHAHSHPASPAPITLISSIFYSIQVNYIIQSCFFQEKILPI